MRDLQLVDCRTVHSLALEFLQERLPNAKLGELRCSNGCKLLMREWFLSEQPQLPPAQQARVGRGLYQSNLVQEASMIWSKMRQGSLPFTHDAYVKYFCTEASATEWLQQRYDSIILDEAQDTARVVLGFLLKLRQCIYFIGDQHQAIYAFRNAQNALRLVQRETPLSFQLTRSFRFGPELAELANSLLKAFHLDNPAIQGTGRTVISGQPIDWSLRWAAIGRSNAQVFQHAVEVSADRSVAFVCRDPNLAPVLEHIGAALRKYGVRGGLDLALLKADIEKAKLAEDVETLRTLKLLKRKGFDQVTKWLRQVRSAVRPMASADCLLGTVHGHKGLEWDNVYLLDDFANLQQLLERAQLAHANGTLLDLTFLIEEVNLVYVAITRAKHNLALHGKVGKFLLSFISATD